MPVRHRGTWLESAHTCGRAIRRRAEDVVVRILECAENLRRFPEMGRIGRATGTREMVVARTRYIIAYRIDEEAIVIARVLHHRQFWPRRI